MESNSQQDNIPLPIHWTVEFCDVYEEHWHQTYCIKCQKTFQCQRPLPIQCIGGFIYKTEICEECLIQST